MEQIRKQLGKIITVVKVRDLSEQDCVERDLLLVRIQRRLTPWSQARAV